MVTNPKESVSTQHLVRLIANGSIRLGRELAGHVPEGVGI